MTSDRLLCIILSVACASLNFVMKLTSSHAVPLLTVLLEIPLILQPELRHGGLKYTFLFVYFANGALDV